jgi:hypothetical protein
MSGPTKSSITLAELRAKNPKIWKAVQLLIGRWIENNLPPEIAPGIAGEARLEAVESWFDQGLLRLRRDPNEPNPVRCFGVEIWNGHTYKDAGRCSNV